ncbi:Stress response protein nst1 [Bienertia sinuspersici]
MEIEGSDGSKTRIKPDSSTIFGRGNGFHSNDISFSCCHISFHFNPSPNSQTDPRVSIEHHENGSIKAFKRFQRGELGIDDLFWISPNIPIWFTVKKVEEVVKERVFENEEIKSRINNVLNQSLETASRFDTIKDFGLDSVDVSSIDPVQEFRFLVIGHEFDQYSKQMIREIKNWNWFLDDSKGETDDEDDTKKKGSTSGRRKRKKTSRGDDDDVDEEWTVENEGDEVAKDARKVQRIENLRQKQAEVKRRKNLKMRRMKQDDEADEDDEEEFTEDEDEEVLED